MANAAGDDTERLEAALAAIPADSGLEGEPEDRFRRLRQRVSQRQSDWRRNMGSLEPLFDDDTHRAKALAGNLATELTELLRIWARLQAELGVHGERPQPLVDWIDDTSALWQTQARGYVALEGFSGDAVEVFDGFLEELCERAVKGAVHELRRSQPTVQGGGGFGSALRRWLGVATRGLGRVFHPRPPRSG